MQKKITIAVDAMGGDNAPKKVIDGISLYFEKNKQIFFKIFGNSEIIKPLLPKTLSPDSYELIHTLDEVKGTDSALGGAKKGKNTSMWLAIDSVKKKNPILLFQQEILEHYL